MDDSDLAAQLGIIPVKQADCQNDQSMEGISLATSFSWGLTGRGSLWVDGHHVEDIIS